MTYPIGIYLGLTYTVEIIGNPVQIGSVPNAVSLTYEYIIPARQTRHCQMTGRPPMRRQARRPAQVYLLKNPGNRFFEHNKKLTGLG